MRNKMANDPAQLVGKGLVMGIIHVLTGPDHLSALATLSANAGNCRAFAYGVRWGIGHSTGLVIVASALIAISKDNEKVNMSMKLDEVLESCVGVFMILLGFYGLYRAVQKKKAQSNDSMQFVDGDILLPPTRTNGQHSTNMTGRRFSSMVSMNTVNLDDSFSDTDEEEDENPTEDDDEPSNNDNSKNIKSKDKLNRQSSIEFLNAYRTGLDVTFVDPKESENSKSKFLALGIGIVHGVAGPGGALGVIPAVKLRQWDLSALYLSCFCSASIVTMAIFAALYGNVTKCLSVKGNIHYQMECCSSILSILAGIVWISLLAVGKLDDIFP